jgi:hypothetical protein
VYAADFAADQSSWDPEPRSMTISVFDLQTKNTVAPVQLVSPYSEGVYLVFEYAHRFYFGGTPCFMLARLCTGRK